MSALEQLLLAYVLNACWQLPVLIVFSLGLLRYARSVPARIQHWLWLLTTGLALVIPMGGFLDLLTATPANAAAAGFAPVSLVGLRLAEVIFVGGAGYQGMRLFAAAIVWRRVRRRATPYASRESVDVLVSPPGMEAGPFLLGLRHPAILIPPFLTGPANHHLLEAAIAHELAHVRRRDMLTLALSELALAPLAFHPAAWWLRRKLSESRELACDELAARDHPGYARCLVEIAQIILLPGAPLYALGISGSHILERRIRAILEGARNAPPKRLRWYRAAALSAISALCIPLIHTARSVYARVSEMPAPKVSVHIPPPPPPPPPTHRR
jgi:beta-lactamase regulating signal transducer with metallopeptidase domain